MAEEKTYYGISKKNVAGQSEEVFKRYNRLLFRAIAEQDKIRKKDQDRTDQKFAQLIGIISKQSEIITDSVDVNDKNSLPNLLKHGFGDISSGISNMRESLAELTLRLKMQLRERDVLADKEVRETTRGAQKEMTRRRQNLRDRSAVSMVLRGLFASQQAPAWSQWIASKMGIRSKETVEQNLHEREQMEVDIAQTKIDIARTKKRRELGGIVGEGIPGMMGVEPESADKLRESLDKLADTVDKVREAMTRMGGEQIITEPVLSVAQEEELQKGFEKGMKFIGEMPARPETRFPIEPPPGGEGGIPVNLGPPPTGGTPGGAAEVRGDKDAFPPISRQGKLIQIMEKEGAMPITFSKTAETSFGKIVKDSVREGLEVAFENLAKGKTYGEVGSEEGMGVISPRPNISEGPGTEVAKTLGKGIGAIAKQLDIFGFLSAGRHQHGGKITQTAGTGKHSFALNPAEGLNVPYDNTIMNVPSNLGMNVVPEQDMKKLASLKTGEKEPDKSTAALETILKELLKTNQKANELLTQLVEKKPETTGIPPISMPSNTFSPIAKSTGHTLSPIGVL